MENEKNHISLGRLGEEYASKYLEEKGWKILERNFRMPIGELDIIAQDQDGTLVFVEVKTIGRFSEGGFSPEDHMTYGKIKRFKRIAELYANARKNLIDKNMGYRLDVIALARVGNEFVLHHYENIE